MIIFLIFGGLVIAGFGAWLLRKCVAEAPEGYEDVDGFHFGRLPRRVRHRRVPGLIVRTKKPADLPGVELPAA